MNRTSKLSLLIALMLLIQVAFAGGAWSTQQVQAAATGPLVTSMSPADNLTNVPTNFRLVMNFDEAVSLGSGSYGITIYNTELNQPIQRISASNVQLNASRTTATITPTSSGIQNDTKYHVLIDPGTFVNVSNGVAYAGIDKAIDWNFQTVKLSDIGTPTHSSLDPLAGTTADITTAMKVQFNKPVFAAGGTITVSTPGDTRYIAVTSSEVQGSGTNQITIKPNAALQPNKTYTVNIPNGVFQDALGANYAGTQWSFTTNPAPVNAVSFTPPNNSTLVPVGSAFRINFDLPVQKSGASGRNVEIREALTNKPITTLANGNITISPDGYTATLQPSAVLKGNTAYYVYVDAGYFTQAGDSTKWYYGISGAGVWNFTTGASADNVKPTVKSGGYSPANNAAVGNVNAKLSVTFTEPVYATNGNIEIRSKTNHSLFRTIPITSQRVTGAGTDTLTIDATSPIAGEALKPFVNNAAYYVLIENGSLRDAAGNLFDGIISNTTWSFSVTQDATRPTITAMTPASNTNTVALDANLYATFSKPIVAGSGAITIYGTGSFSGEEITTTFSVDPLNNKRLIILPDSGFTAGASYYVYIEEDAVYDAVGNPFVGILNEYQWTFKTLGSDSVPPAVNTIQSNGSAIIMTYNEPLNESVKPSPGSFYVTVNGAYRAVSSVQVKGEQVILTLTSAVLSGQLVKLSYTKASPKGLIQDLTGNEAISLVNRDATAITDTTAPRVVSAYASGSTITLGFSKSLYAVSSYAFSQFSVNVGGSNYTPISISGSGSSVTLVVNTTITSSQYVRISYTSGSYPLRDTLGNQLASFSNYAATNGVDTTAPVLQSLLASGSTVTLTYNENLNSAVVPSTSQYSVIAGGIARGVTSVQVSGSSVLLSLSSAVTAGQAVTVSYAPSIRPLADMAGNAAAPFSSLQAAIDSGVGKLSSLTVKASELTLSFRETLHSSYVPAASRFVVKVNGASKIINAVSVAGATAKLTLAAPVGIGESVTISYYTSATGFRTSGGEIIDSFTDLNVSNQTTAADVLPDGFESADGGGVGLKATAATTLQDISPGNKSAKRYTIIADQVTLGYQTARTSGMSSPRVVFKVPSTEAAGIVAIPLSPLQTALSLNANSVFAVQFGNVSYDIPLNALDFTAITSSVYSGGTAPHILVEIDQGNSTVTSALANAITSSRAQMISGPYNFEISALNGSQEKPITGFRNYLLRSIKITSSLNTAQTAVVWYDPEAGGLSYVPTVIAMSGNQATVTFKRKGNSAYALISTTASFSDVANHWASSYIHTLSRKYIVEAYSSTRYEPKLNITRGEFATYIAKGLGLSGNKAAAARFSDVATGTKMAAYIGAASEAGIVLGNTNGTFSPNDPITRQEMSVMMIRAATVAGVNVTLPQTTATYLQRFKDKSKISAYAQADVAKAVYIGIINGTSATEMSPLRNATRAEGAVMITRLLQYAKLITL